MKHFWQLMDLFFTYLVLLEDEQAAEEVPIGHIL